MQDITFDITKEDRRAEVLANIKSHGLTDEAAQALFDLSLRVAHSILSQEFYLDIKVASRDDLVFQIITCLGSKFTDEQRKIIDTNYPKTGMINLVDFWDQNIKALMSHLSSELHFVVLRWSQESLKVPLGESKKAIHYLIQRDLETTQEEFDKLVSALDTIPGVGVEDYPNNVKRVSLFFDKVSFRADLELIDTPVTEIYDIEIPRSRIVVKTERVDDVSISMLADIGLSLGFRVFSLNLKSLLPLDRQLFDIYNGFLKPEVTKVLLDRGFNPLFSFRYSYSMYAQKVGSEEIYFINGELLSFLSSVSCNKPSDEFSYKVADNIIEFVTKYDSGLIPIDFYKYYKKSFKIINFSNFDIDHIDRKVFVKPYILELNARKQGFYTIAGKESGAIVMTKVLPHETLDMTLRRFLKDDLGVSSDYIGAVIARDIEFDLDKQNNLIPRLVISVYIDESLVTPEQKEKLARGWFGTP